ncbi:hypothetical protein BKA62DRAFT_771862 [Auriculariales sp. MPI-PUGE-AT-0066]|nr:hypothetical protein BKA62DRAFT_771862 [Auriculariales sp. MPI-PUGE-AT-0066]
MSQLGAEATSCADLAEATLGSSIRCRSRPLRLPLELLRIVLEEAARSAIELDAPFATNLMRISRAARLWLLPITYYVFVVRYPQDRNTIPGSFALFLQLQKDVAHILRKHIRHVVLLGPYFSSLHEQFFAEQKVDEWPVESVTVGDHQRLTIFAQSGLNPRHLYIGRQRFNYGIIGAVGLWIHAKFIGRIREICVALPVGGKRDETVDLDLCLIIPSISVALAQLSRVEPQNEKQVVLRLKVAVLPDADLGCLTAIILALLRFRCLAVILELEENASNCAFSYTSVERALADATSADLSMRDKLYIERSCIPATVADHVQHLRSGAEPSSAPLHNLHEIFASETSA